ncbi:MAG: murein L,D-transpeptidase catalytic domain family protein [Gemmatimonadaceae bacterium]|nr:murein L,D-transpeptidase catalytic domain family protein [Acetobacteraceae bacterium]
MLDRARATLDCADGRIVHRDRIGVVDFSRPSRAARFHVVDLAGGTAVTHLVAHVTGPH